MRRPGRGLTPDEAALWGRVAQTVKPMEGKRAPALPELGEVRTEKLPRVSAKPAPPSQKPTAAPPRSEDRRLPPERHGLDASWDRKLARGLTMLQIVTRTKSLGRKVEGGEDDWVWHDAGGSSVRLHFERGRLKSWQIERPT